MDGSGIYLSRLRLEMNKKIFDITVSEGFIHSSEMNHGNSYTPIIASFVFTL